MLRLLASLTLAVLANAIGLVVASLLLDDFQINGAAFIVAVVIFTGSYVLFEPLITKVSLTQVPALRGGVALVATFVALFITNLVSSGISINGVRGWILATIVVWLFSLIATLVLPLFLFKKALGKQTNAKKSDEQ
jgi:hypothetical protein